MGPTALQFGGLAFLLIGCSIQGKPPPRDGNQYFQLNTYLGLLHERHLSLLLA